MPKIWMHCNAIFEKQSKEIKRCRAAAIGKMPDGSGARRTRPPRQAEVAASGITPLGVMLDNMRVAHRRAKELEN
jgi:hypothetical protein